MQHPAFSHPDPVWLHVSSVRPQCVCVITHVALVDALGRHVGLFFIAEYVHGMHFVHESYKFLVGMELLSSLNFTVTFTLAGLQAISFGTERDVAVLEVTCYVLV